MKKPIVIVGSYNVGLFLKGRRLPATGETIIADQFHEGPGGKGSNQAITAAMFGAEVKFVGRVGVDSYGRDALELYKRTGISTELITIDKTVHSGISVILIDSDGNNMISVALGANLKITNKDIDRATPVIGNSMLTGFQLENNHDAVFYGIRRAREMGAMTFLDPAPAVKLPDDIYPCIDIIKPNETEAGILTGIEVRDIQGAEAAGHWLLERGAGMAMVTLGAQGAVLVDKDKARHFPAPRVRSIDSTGAGDIFSGSFMAALSAGKPLEEAVNYASAAAALSTTRLGVIESIPGIPEVEEMLKKGW